MRTIREAVGVFASTEALDMAVEALQSAGFDRAELSILAPEALTVPGDRTTAYADDPDAPRQPPPSGEHLGLAQGGVTAGLAYVGAALGAGVAVASGGTALAAAMAAAAAGGAGGLTGGIFAKIFGDEWHDRLDSLLAGGGVVLFVRTDDRAQERKAVEILERNGAKDARVHDLPVAPAVPEAGAARAETAQDNPGSVYARPADVLADPDLDDGQKERVLRRWLNDAEAPATAPIAPGIASPADEIRAALRELGEV